MEDTLSTIKVLRTYNFPSNFSGTRVCSSAWPDILGKALKSAFIYFLFKKILKIEVIEEEKTDNKQNGIKKEIGHKRAYFRILGL